MQELLGRLRALDPDASLGLRVIACFDELIVGNVNTRALLSAAASLAGCVAGFLQDEPFRSMRVAPDGGLLPAPSVVPSDVLASETIESVGGFSVWLERETSPLANDAITLERLALGLRIRHGRVPRELNQRRDLGVLMDESTPIADRIEIAARLGIDGSTLHRIGIAPLFATWQRHPEAREDVQATPFGPVHVLLLPADVTALEASPAGVGPAVTVADLPRSYKAALIALRLADPPQIRCVNADEYGGLLELLSDFPGDHSLPDTESIARIADLPWGAVTLDAIARTGTLREAARSVGIHHSTMRTRLDAVETGLGFDPMDGLGRVRFGMAYLMWRLRQSRVLELPAPNRSSTPA